MANTENRYFTPGINLMGLNRHFTTQTPKFTPSFYLGTLGCKTTVIVVLDVNAYLCNKA